jgi:hypothetical protein
MADNEAWCVKCKKAVKAHLTKHEKPRILKGKCSFCGTNIARICSQAMYDKAK